MSRASHIRKLPPFERDVLRLHLDLRKPQTEVAKILGVSQPSVNYRCKRARERLEFMEKLPEVTTDEIRLVLHRLGARESDIEAMTSYFETSSQSEVARRMDTSQGAVRHWIHRAIVNHLQNDMSLDDVHRRVRTACLMLVHRPGILSDPPKPINGVRATQTRRLQGAPKIAGEIRVGELVTIKDGTYRDLQGEVMKVDEEVRVLLDLASIRLELVWSS